MTGVKLSNMPTDELILLFEEICLAQSKALRRLRSGQYNVFYGKMVKVRAVLKERNERALLASLYTHADPHVRFQAAMATLALFPDRARAVLTKIADNNEWPSDIDARGILRSLDAGTFIPA